MGGRGVTEIRGQLSRGVFSFHHVSSRDWIRAFRHGRKCLCSLRYSHWGIHQLKYGFFYVFSSLNFIFVHKIIISCPNEKSEYVPRFLHIPTVTIFTLSTKLNISSIWAIVFLNITITRLLFSLVSPFNFLSSNYPIKMTIWLQSLHQKGRDKEKHWEKRRLYRKTLSTFKTPELQHKTKAKHTSHQLCLSTLENFILRMIYFDHTLPYFSPSSSS